MPAKARDPVQVQLPERVTKALSEIAASLKNKEVQLPENVTKPLAEIADALTQDGVKASEDPVWNFIEYWFWLLGFTLVAFAAFYLGIRDSIKAITRETDAEEARSAQRLIEANDSTGEGKLAAIQKKYPIDPDDMRRVRNGWWLALTIFVFALGFIGGLGLLALAFAPENAVWWDTFHVQHAKRSAWNVLDTNFAAAFAATWIALLFYGASQNHRLREANSNLRIATNEAESKRNYRLKRDLDNTFDKYTELRATVLHQNFDVPGIDIAKYAETTTQRHIDNVRRIQAVAVARAVNDVELSKEKDKIDRIEAEIARLKQFAPPQLHMRWIIPWDFARFLARLLAVPNLIIQSRDEWGSFHDAISREVPDNDKIHATAETLAEKLPKLKAA